MQTTNIICDYCGEKHELKRCYSHHDDRSDAPKVVRVEIRALYNDSNARFMRTKPPKHVAERLGVGAHSTNGTICLELCVRCMRERLFESFDIRDPSPEPDAEKANQGGEQNDG